MTAVPDMTPEEARWLQERRAQQAMEAGPPQPSPLAPQITNAEWNLIQLHRIAEQSRIPGSGIVANTPDPMQQLHAVAIVVLRSIKEELNFPLTTDGTGGDGTWKDSVPQGVCDLLDRWLGILGADGQKARSSDPGAG